jgi:signal transduction histidine kinase
VRDSESRLLMAANKAASPGTDRAQRGLEYALKVLHPAVVAQGIDKWLAELARLFVARSAGLAGPLWSKPPAHRLVGPDERAVPSRRLPWEVVPGLLADLRRAPAAVKVTTEAGDNLLAAALAQPSGVTWLLWMQGDADHEWCEDDVALLPVVGQLLVRAVGEADGGLLERWRLQQRLEEAATVAGWLAHDFGNVLTGVLGFAELALDQAPPGSELHDFLREIRQTADRGAEFIRKLLCFSRRQRSRAEVARLADVADQVAGRVRVDWGDAITLRVAVPADLPSVVLAADALGEVLHQLLDNARRALPVAGEVRVSARRVELDDAACAELLGHAQPGSFVEVEVADTGHGLSQEMRQRLLSEPFFSTRPRHRGLGLPVVYGILHSHGGGFRLETPGTGGTTARVFLPAAGR